MKRVLLGAVLVWAAMVQAEESPPSPLASKQVADCAEALMKNPKLLPALAEEMLSYLKRQNKGDSHSNVFGDAQVVAQAGDALIVRQKPGLRIVRQPNFNDSTFATLSLKGREVVQFYVQDGFFVILTKEPGTQEFYLQIVNPSLARISVLRRFKKLGET